MPSSFEYFRPTTPPEVKDKKPPIPKDSSPESFAEYVKNFNKAKEEQDKSSGRKNNVENKNKSNNEKLPEQSKELLREIKEVKARQKARNIMNREKNRDNHEKRREMDIEDARWQAEVASFIKENENDNEILEIFWELFDNEFIDEKNETSLQQRNMTKNSILGSLATENILEGNLKEKFKLSKVECAQPEIDVDYKIDAWVETKDKNGEEIKIAIQFLSKSCDNLQNEDKKFLMKNGMVQFFDELDLKREWKKFANTPLAEEMDDKIDKTKEGCFEYIRDYEKKMRGAKLVLMFVTMPVGIEKRKKIVGKNGKPLNKQIINQFCKQFEYEFDRKINNIEIL